MKIEKTTIFFLVAVCCVLFPTMAFSQDSGKAKKQRVVVLDVDGGGVVDSQQSAAMADSLSATLVKTKKFDVVSREDFQKAVKAHEQKTGSPCKDSACLNMIARSLGAHPVKASVKKNGGGCSVSVGIMGADGKSTASGSVTRPCSPRNYKIATQGATWFLTNEINNGAPVDEIDRNKEKQALNLSEQAPMDEEEQLDEEFDEATQPKTDIEAEKNAKRLEEQARKQLGLGK